ncbi:MAG TPA: hypothetical protein VHC21_04050 [Candidatus Saccharimonadales bacterium]|nr:hypothetical protein [Candidatus Saccharimonadales bacterium]
MADAQELLDGFSTETFPPVLDESAQLMVRGLLRSQGRHMSHGVWPIGSAFGENTETSTETLLQYDQEAKRTLELQDDAIIGPYFLGGEYHSGAIGVWVRD